MCCHRSHQPDFECRILGRRNIPASPCLLWIYTASEVTINSLRATETLTMPCFAATRSLHCDHLSVCIVLCCMPTA